MGEQLKGPSPSLSPSPIGRGVGVRGNEARNPGSSPHIPITQSFFGKAKSQSGDQPLFQNPKKGRLPMTLTDLKASLPDYAKDLRLNLDSVLSEGGAPGLTRKQIALIALSSAIASRHEPLTRALAAAAALHTIEAEWSGARAAAAIMALNNVYY